MKKINILIAFSLLYFSNTYSQGLDTTNWFPYTVSKRCLYLQISNRELFCFKEDDIDKII